MMMMMVDYIVQIKVQQLPSQVKEVVDIYRKLKLSQCFRIHCFMTKA